MINKVGVKWGAGWTARELGSYHKTRESTNTRKFGARWLSCTRSKMGSGTIWWWNFPKIHLAPNNKHREITSGAQVEKYHFLTLMLECQAPGGGFEGPAGVCLCKFGTSSITIVPTSQQEKTAMWQTATSKSVLEATLLDLTSSTVSSAVAYLGHHYYHTVATLGNKLPVRKGASCFWWNFLHSTKWNYTKFSPKHPFSLETQTPSVVNPMVNGGSDKMNENCYK